MGGLVCSLEGDAPSLPPLNIRPEEKIKFLEDGTLLKRTEKTSTELFVDLGKSPKRDSLLQTL